MWPQISSSGSSQSSINELLAVFNGYDGVSNNQPEGPLSLAVEKLRQSFLENKDVSDFLIWLSAIPNVQECRFLGSLFSYFFS
jgi:hypothetical protein